MYNEHVPHTRLLSNIPVKNAELIRKAAKETGFDIEIRDDTQDDRGRSVLGCVSVWTNEPYGLDHGAFWRAYRRL